MFISLGESGEMTKMAKVLEEHTVFGEAQGTEFLDPGEQKA